MTPSATCQREYRASLLDLIGRTPLVRLTRLEEDVPGVELYGKAEWKNPGGSVKDRPAQRMILEGLGRPQLAPGRRMLDATSGNTGIAYAMIGAALGFRVTLCVPANVTPERSRILAAYGAELVFTDPMEGSDGAIREARRRFAADPAAPFYPRPVQQRLQLARALRHHRRRDLVADRRPHHALRRRPRHQRHVHGHRPAAARAQTGRRSLVSVQPESPLHGLEGLKHMASAIVPGIYDATLAAATWACPPRTRTR